MRGQTGGGASAQWIRLLSDHGSPCHIRPRVVDNELIEIDEGSNTFKAEATAGVCSKAARDAQTSHSVFTRREAKRNSWTVCHEHSAAEIAYNHRQTKDRQSERAGAALASIVSSPRPRSAGPVCAFRPCCRHRPEH